MSVIGEIVARLIAAGTPPEVAAVAVAEAFEAGACVGKSTGQSADSATEKRRAYDRERARIKREIHRTSADSPPTSENALTKEVSKKAFKKERGSRISPDWKPSETDSEFATSKGIKPDRIPIEIEKFSNYWTAKSGASAIKLDWSATWRNWILSAAERAGVSPPTGPPSDARAAYLPPPGCEPLEVIRARHKKSNGEAGTAQIRNDPRVGEDGPDRSAELPLSR